MVMYDKPFPPLPKVHQLLKCFKSLCTTTIPTPPTRFLSRYVVSIVKCSFHALFNPLFHLLSFIFGPLFVSFSIFMGGNMNKEKVEKMLKGQSSREAKLDFE